MIIDLILSAHPVARIFHVTFFIHLSLQKQNYSDRTHHNYLPLSHVSFFKASRRKAQNKGNDIFQSPAMWHVFSSKQ